MTLASMLAGFGKVGRQRRQLAVGPGCQRRFEALIKLLGCQPAVPGGHPQLLDDGVPVRVGGPEPAVGRATRRGYV